MRPLARTPRTAAPLAVLALVAPVLLGGAPAQAARATSTVTSTKHFDSSTALRTGTVKGAAVSAGSVVLKSPKTVKVIAGTRYAAGTWTSPWVATKNFTELIPSWNATTPGHSLVEVRVRLRAGNRTGSWDTVARWTSQPTGTVSGKAVYARKSWTKQSDDLASVLTDTVRTKSTAGADGWQVKVVLMRRSGTKAAPTLNRVSAMSSRVVARTSTSAPGSVAKAGIVLDVPRYSQMTHAGHHPQWGNGGEAWCSPTSLAMVLEYHQKNPAEGHAFTPTLKGKAHADGIVDFTARAVYDHRYRGTGNWGFNTAYAAQYLPKSRVTRLPHLRATEKYLAAGKPLIVSVAFGKGQLKGAPISSTPGHLMVLVGFTPDGNVIVNDPAAKKNDQVRRLYDRAEFERAWLSRSGGLTYLLEK